MANKIFEGLGPGTLVPQRGKVSFNDPRLGAEEGFVLSRVDGQTSLEEICLLVPFEETVTMVILRRLWEMSAIEVPGVARVMARSTQTTPALRTDAGPSLVPKREEEAKTKRANPFAPDGQSGGTAATDAADAKLSADVARRIDEFFGSLDTRNAFQLLEIERTADTKAVKRAYFKLSKEFHPDRYFGRELGDYRDKLTKIFQAIKAAFELLSDENRRRAYEESV